MTETNEEENLLVTSNVFDEELEFKEQLDPMDEENLSEVPLEEVTDDDISDEKLLEGMEDNTILLDAVKQYLISIGRYRMLSGSEQLSLARRYRNGDMEARQTLIVHNLRLVVVVAKKLLRHARKLEFLDLIQEGNLGLMKAIDLFNPDYNFYFSTYAYRAIYTNIQRAINEKDSIMHTPEWARITYHKYKEFRKEYLLNHGEEPPKEVVKKKYNIDDKTYRALVNFEQNVLNPRSLDEKMDDGDKESDSLENFIPDTEKGYDHLNDELDKRIYMHKLKESLAPIEYYIVYYRLLSEEPKTLEQLGDELGVTRERIRQLGNKYINKAKSILKSTRSRKDNISISQVMHENFIPPTVEEVIILAELKEKLDEDDYYIFYHTWYKKHKVSLVAEKMALSEKEIRERINYIICTYPTLITDREYAKNIFLDSVKSKGSSKVYNQIIDLEPNFNPVEEISKIVRKMTYKQARQMVGSLYDAKFSERDRKLFAQYFDQSIKTIHLSVIERTSVKINAINSHYQDSPYIDKKKLYKIMLDNQEKYTDRIIDYLKKTYFKEESGYNGSPPIGEKITISYYLNLFERLYYDLDEYSTYLIPKEDVEKIIWGTKYRFTEEEKQIMTLKYGLNGTREHTLVEMAKIYNLDYVTMHDKYHKINYKVIDIYVGRHVMNNYSNPLRYRKYIEDNRYLMTSETRDAARLYFIEGKTYKEIIDIMGIRDTTRVSNILTEAARKMDFWEYGMVDFPVYEPELVDNVFSTYHFSLLEEKAIRLRTDEGLMPDDVKYLLGDEAEDLDISYLMQSFTNKYVNLNGRKKITIKDIRYQVICPICDSILSDDERKITSYIYGIKCSYNPDGEKKNTKDISKLMGFTSDEIHNKISKINYSLCAHQVGLANAPFSELTRDETREILKDPHVPISDYERELLTSIKGLNGKYWTLSELQKKYKVNGKGSIARRINRAILTIRKYQAGEIDKKIIYEIDIKPILKYFGEYHRNIIIMRYRDNMLVKDMGKKLGLSKNVMDSYFGKIERKVLYLLKNPKAKKFDYDYAREVIHNPDLPFYGDFDVAYKYYLRMSGEDGMRPGGASTIDDEKILDQKGNASTHYYLLMTAVLKYRDGIRKVRKIDVDDLEEFYLANKDKYSISNQKLFEVAIRNLRKVYPVFGRKFYSPFVINEYMKAKGMNTFSFESMTSDDAKNFIRENPYNLTKADLERVRNYFGITSREMMSGKNQLRLLKLLDTPALDYYQKRKKRVENLVAKGRNDALKYKNITEEISSPNINAFDLVKSLKEIDNVDNGVLITSPILDLIYAHIRAHHDVIDVLTMEEIYAYVFALQKFVMSNSAQELYNFFSKPLFPGSVFGLKNKNPKVWAFFDSILQNRKNAEAFRLKYNKRDSAAISPQYYSANFKEFKNRVKKAQVNFSDEIPDKLYSIINIGDEIMQTDPEVAKEIIREYKDYLINEGSLIAYFKEDADIPSIFEGEQYKVIDVRTPRAGVNYGGKNVQQDKVVIMQKKKI